MIETEADISDLIAIGFAEGPLLRRDKADFAPGFWSLPTGLLGSLAQKLVNYGMVLEVSGDLSAELAASRALRDFFRESQARGPIRLAEGPATVKQAGG